MYQVFSKADEIVDVNEEIQKSVYPSVFDSQFVHGFMTSVSLFVLVSVFAALAYFTDAVPVPVEIVSVLYVAPLAGFIRNGIKRRMIMYHFTGEQLIEEEGIMNKDYQSIQYDRIQDVQLDEDFEERMFNVGDLLIKTAGSSGAEVRLEGLKDPESYQRLISNRSSSSRDSEGEFSSNNSGTSFDSSGSQDVSGTEDDALSQDMLDNELSRVESELERLNEKSRSQGLSKSERKRWYKLEGQKELLNRIEDQTEDSNSEFSTGQTAFGN